jgi:hypothetical protein
VPVNARAGIPAGVRLGGIVHLDGDGVIAGAENEVRRQVVPEGDVAEGTFAEILAVDPDLAVFEHAFEFDEEFLAAGRLGQAEVFAIPSDARGQAALGSLLLTVGPFDAPVVRHIQASPIGIGKAGLLRSRHVALVEFPAEVEAVSHPRCGVLGGRLRLGGRGPRGLQR